MRVAIMFAILVLASPCSSMAQQTEIVDSHPTITVDGEAAINVKPDQIVISLGIETRDLEITAAKQKNNEILKKALTEIRGMGIPEREIQTDHISISVERRYRNDLARDELFGYLVQNSLLVTLNEANKVEELILKALQAGVNTIHGINFQTTELRKYRDQARELALKAAREKAEAMAAVLG
jgi:uncharacterized protein